MASRDTAPTAAALHEEAYRNLGLEGRLRIAMELSNMTHLFATTGIRQRNPKLSEEGARRQLAEILYGAEMPIGK